jgi:hypothetical protein
VIFLVITTALRRPTTASAGGIATVVIAVGITVVVTAAAAGSAATFCMSSVWAGFGKRHQAPEATLLLSALSSSINLVPVATN